MKARPLQRKQTRKRTLTTPRTATAAQKRRQTQQEADNTTAPSPQRREGNPTIKQTREPRTTAPAPSSSDRTENRPTTPAPPTSRRDEGSPRIMATVRPQPRLDTPSNASTQPSVSRDVMVEQLKASEKRMLKHYVSQQRVLLERIEGLENVLNPLAAELSEVKSSVEDLKMMVLPSTTKSSKTTSQRTSTRPRNKSKNDALKDEIEAAHPTLPAQLKIIFATHISSLAAARTIAAQMVKFHRRREGVSVSSLAMNVFLYSCKRGRGKAVMKEGIGFRHGEFRYKIAKTMLELAKTLPEHIFSANVASSSAVERGRDSGDRETKPSWLTSDLVDANSLTLARMHHEWFASDLPKDPTAPERRKALYIAKRFFKMSVDLLRQSLDKSKVRMFEDGTYCLVKWEQLKGFPSELSNPNLSFLWPEEDVVAPSTVPENSTGPVDDVRENNEIVLQQLITERKEMLIEASFDGIVSKETTAKARREDPNREIKSMRRVINILRIAKSFLCGFCLVPEEELLSAHPAMLQCLYRFAVVIRGIFLDYIQQSVPKRSSTGAGGESMQQTSRRTNAEHAEGDAASRDESDGTAGDVRDGNGDRGGNGDQPERRKSRDNEQRSSRGRDRTADAEREPARPDETPPLALQTLYPADSERDRIIENYTNVSYENYRRMSDALEGEDQALGDAQGDVVSDAELPHQDSDSDDDDDMPDMFVDDE